VRCPTCDAFVDIPDEKPDVPELTGSASQSPTHGNFGASQGHSSLPNATLRKTAILEPIYVDAGDTVMLEAAVPLGGSGAPVLQTPVPPQEPKSTAEATPAPERAFTPKKHLEDPELDMTPMVDVVFQLLIFFMLTAAFALQKSLTLPKPADDQPTENVVA
jgi:hypothetical protein